MEQPENETEDENQLVLGGEKVDDSEVDALREPNATFLIDLNLLIVALSLSSIRDDDCLNLVDTEKKDINDHEANKGKARIPRFQARKRETNDLKLMRPQTQRKTQPTPKEIRHCRKM